jgi:hypothetical protein
MSERDIIALEDAVRYLRRTLSVACDRLERLEAQVQSLQMSAPRGIPSAQSERADGTREDT